MPHNWASNIFPDIRDSMIIEACCSTKKSQGPYLSQSRDIPKKERSIWHFVICFLICKHSPSSQVRLLKSGSFLSNPMNTFQFVTPSPLYLKGNAKYSNFYHVLTCTSCCRNASKCVSLYSTWATSPLPSS